MKTFFGSPVWIHAKCHEMNLIKKTLEKNIFGPQNCRRRIVDFKMCTELWKSGNLSTWNMGQSFCKKKRKPAKLETGEYVILAIHQNIGRLHQAGTNLTNLIQLYPSRIRCSLIINYELLAVSHSPGSFGKSVEGEEIIHDVDSRRG